MQAAIGGTLPQVQWTCAPCCWSCPIAFRECRNVHDTGRFRQPSLSVSAPPEYKKCRAFAISVRARHTRDGRAVPENTCAGCACEARSVPDTHTHTHQTGSVEIHSKFALCREQNAPPRPDMALFRQVLGPIDPCRKGITFVGMIWQNAGWPCFVAKHLVEAMLLLAYPLMVVNLGFLPRQPSWWFDGYLLCSLG